MRTPLPPGYALRTAGADEPEALRDIERAAGEVFRDIGMPEIAGDEPLPRDTLAAYQRAGRAWVAVGPAGRVVAYLIAAVVDGDLHIDQVSVHPAAARRGLGRALIDLAADVAAREGLAALTLTTFADVPWNAPYYARCGFVPLDERDLGPGLREIRRREAALGLDRWPRVCMRREIRTGGRP